MTTTPISPSAASSRSPDRTPSIAESATVTVLFVGATASLLWAVSNPLVALALAVLLVGGTYAARRVRDRRLARRRAGRSRRVCLPGVNVCVDV